MQDPASPLSHVNLNLFPVLATLLRTHSVTKAAIALGVGQSAVSHALRELRSLLEDPLLVRTAQGMEPTPRALELAPHINLALESLSAGLRQNPQFDPAQSKRRFSIAATDELATNFLPALVNLLEKESPASQLSIESTGPEHDLMRLRQGQIDMLIGLAPKGSKAGLCLDFVYEDSFVCVLRSAHPKLAKRMTMKRFLELPHILVSPDGHGLGMVDVELAKLGHKRHILVSTRYFLSAPEIVASTDCVLTLPTRFAKRMAERLDLAILKAPIDIPSFSVYSITSKTRGSDPALAWLGKAVARASTSIV